MPTPPGERREPRGATPSGRRPRCSRRELAARRDVDPSRSRTWRIANRGRRNGLGQPTAYKLAARRHADAAGRSRARASAAAPPSRRTTCGSPPSPPRSAGRRATTPTSTRAAPGCRRGRRGTAPSSTPTSCCGTPSASPTSRDPRTGRSCRSSTPASRWSRSASSTATPRSTCRPRPTTVMTEQGGPGHSPQEYHPPVEEYLETMLALAEEGVPVIQARIAERLGRSAPSVSEMLDRLIEDGYVTRDGRRLSLTDERPGAGREGRAQAPPGRAPAGRRHRARVAQGAPRGGALGARDLRRRRGPPGRAAGRPRHLPARQPDPGLALAGAGGADPARWPRSARASGCASSASARRSSSTSAR